MATKLKTAVKKKTAANTTWFIYTGGNRLAEDMIAGTGRIGPEDECPDMLCADKITRFLIRCPDAAFVAAFEEAAKDIQPVPYKIFRKVGPSGKIEEHPLVL